MFPDVNGLKEIGERIATSLEKIATMEEKAINFLKAMGNIADKAIEKMPEDLKDSDEGEAMLAMYEEFKEACNQL